MRVNSINFNTSFKSANRLGYGDSISDEKRDFIRRRIDDKVLYNVDYFLNEGRKSEFEEKKMIDDLKGKYLDKIFNQNNMYKIGANAYPFDKKNNWRGKSLVDYSSSVFCVLKAAKIDTIIDLVRYDKYKKKAEEAEMNYLSIPIDDESFRTSPIFMNEKTYIKYYSTTFEPDEEEKEILKYNYNFECRQFIDSFIPIVQALQKGNCYISCQFGTGLTTKFLDVFSLFNPETTAAVDSISREERISYGNMYKNLSSEDKAKMGWTKEFDENFIPYLDSITEEENMSYVSNFVFI